MSLKEMHVIIFVSPGNNISCYGDKSVLNCIMGSSTFVAMSTM